MPCERLWARRSSAGDSGWAAASVARVILGPGGPLRAEKLSLSPMLNRSALVKSPMLAYADGSHALPAYFEMGQMHGLLVRFHPDGRVADTRRMDGAGLNPIQPMIVPLDGRRAVAFLRDFDVKRGCLLRCETEDGGQSWSAPIRVNQDPENADNWQWMGTLSVCPAAGTQRYQRGSRAPSRSAKRPPR